MRALAEACDSPRALQGDRESRKVHLSLRLADVCAGLDRGAAFDGAVLPACIRTVEDHGYALVLGAPGVSAFLPAADFAAAFGVAARPMSGQLLQVVVKQLLRGGSDAVVGCLPTDVATGALPAHQAVTHSNLLPGQLVMVRTQATAACMRCAPSMHLRRLRSQRLSVASAALKDG
jgi:rRNA biogenesis protein RRP5